MANFEKLAAKKDEAMQVADNKKDAFVKERDDRKKRTSYSLNEGDQNTQIKRDYEEKAKKAEGSFTQSGKEKAAKFREAAKNL